MTYDFSAGDIRDSLLKVAGDKVDPGVIDPSKLNTYCKNCENSLQTDAPVQGRAR